MVLTPSKRVVLMKEISQRLGQEDWLLIDTTLRAFSLPTQNEWNGTQAGYVLRMLEGGQDQALLALAEHVGFQTSAGPTRVDPPFWRKNMFKLFLSHLSAHREYAGQLQEHLQSFGISCFVAHNDIEPTLEWQNEIQTALATCDALIALLHSGFHTSKWTDQEIGFAMGRGVPSFCVRFGEDPYGFIGRFQAFNGHKKNAGTLAKELFDAYRKNKQTQHLMANSIITMFAESNSFANAKSNMNLVEELESWDANFPARLRSALKHNPQIADAFGVPERLEALLKKRK